MKNDSEIIWRRVYQMWHEQGIALKKWHMSHLWETISLDAAQL